MPTDNTNFEHLPILEELGSDLRRAFTQRELHAAPATRRSSARSRRGLVVLAACLLMSATALAATQPWKTLDDAVEHGQRPVAPAPDQTLSTLDGAGVSSLRAYRGRTVVLSFWASWCSSCRAQTKTLEAAGQRLREDGKGLAVLVSYKDNAREALAFVRDRRLRMPVLDDRGGKLARAFGTRTLPQTFVIDGRGHVVAISRMPASPGFLKHAIAAAAKPSGTLPPAASPQADSP